MQTELGYAVYDPANGTWSASAAIDDPALADLAPEIAGPLANGDLIVHWTRSRLEPFDSAPSGLPPFADTFFAVWDNATGTLGTPRPVIDYEDERFGTSFAAGGDTGVMVFGWDPDPDDGDTSDVEVGYRIWNPATGTLGPRQMLTSDSVRDVNPHVMIVDRDGPGQDIYVVWTKGNDLVVDINFAGTPTVIHTSPDQSQTSAGEIKLVNLGGGRIAVVWGQGSAEGATLTARIYDPATATWGGALELTPGVEVQQLFGTARDNLDNLVLLFTETALTFEDGTFDNGLGGTIDAHDMPVPGENSIKVGKLALSTDLAFTDPDDLAVEGSVYLPGETIRMRARVRNTGALGAAQAKVAFYNGNPLTGGTLITTVTSPTPLAAGESVELSADWVLPSALPFTTICAVADPDGTVEEFSESNNLAAKAAGGVNLVASAGANEIEPDGSGVVRASVTNVAAPASAPCNAQLLDVDTGAVIATQPLAAVQPGETVAVEFPFAPGGIPEPGLSFTFKVDTGNAVAESDETDNSTVLWAINLVDEDEDGVPRYFEEAHGTSDSNPADAAEDGDGDGYTLAQEYAVCTLPNDAESRLLLQTDLSALGSGQANLQWTGKANVLYDVERSYDLITWEAVYTDLTRQADGPIEFTDTPDPAQTKVFYRLRGR